MTWQSAVNAALERTTGLRLVRAAEPQPALQQPSFPANKLLVTRATKAEVRPPARPKVDRLLQRPIFLLSAVRSGSTLLRLMLNEHSMLHAPHELHVRRLRVVPTNGLSKRAMDLLGHNEADLEHLLWDRVLHRELALSGKQVIVDKTPSNSFVFRRIQTCWPDARFIFLLRHPASIATSWTEASRGKRTSEESVADALRYMCAVERARDNLSGLTVRYEELATDPEKATREICDFLDIPWEGGMLNYGNDREFVKGVGDWSQKIRSGSVQPPRDLPLDTDIPPALVDISQRWGYLREESGPVQ
jgi:hypothetical protein